MQCTIALSSGETEYYALLRSSAKALGIKAMLNDLRYGVECEIRMRCDSSAARGTSARQGHLDMLTCAFSCGCDRQYRMDV